MMSVAESCWVGLGFHTTVLPMSTGAPTRFAAIEVKLNGEIARTNPSSGRWSVWFHWPRAETRGWRAYSSLASATPKRKKSHISQTASISDW